MIPNDSCYFNDGLFKLNVIFPPSKLPENKIMRIFYFFNFVFSQNDNSDNLQIFNDYGHENVSNNIDPVLLSFMYIILLLILYFIIDFLLWIFSLLF